MKRLLIIITMICCLGLCGCGDRIDLDSLGLVLGVGLDLVPEKEIKNGEKVRIVVEMDNVEVSNEGQDNSNEGFFLESTGKTVAEAFSNLSSQVEKNLSFGHMKVLIVGDSVAKDSLNNYLDYFLRNAEVPPLIYLLLTEGETKKVFDSKNKMMRFVSTDLAFMLSGKKNKSNGKFVSTTMQDYLETMIIPHQSILLPVVSTLKDPTSIELKKIAVLDYNGTFVEYLDQDCHVGSIMFLEDNFHFMLPIKINNTLEKVSMDVKEVKKKKQWSFVDGHPQLTYKISTYCVIKSIMGYRESKYFDTNEDANICKNVLTKYAYINWQNALEMEQDYLLIGNELRKHYYDYWLSVKDDWPRAMKDIKLNVEINSRIDHVNDINRLFWKRDD
ncbi:MAG: Ger(x)C family spore germination protein [Bacillota bacterium]